MTAVRRSQSTWSYGLTPSVLKARGTTMPARPRADRAAAASFAKPRSSTVAMNVLRLVSRDRSCCILETETFLVTPLCTKIHHNIQDIGIPTLRLEWAECGSPRDLCQGMGPTQRRHAAPMVTQTEPRPRAENPCFSALDLDSTGRADWPVSVSSSTWDSSVDPASD